MEVGRPYDHSRFSPVATSQHLNFVIRFCWGLTGTGAPDRVQQPAPTIPVSTHLVLVDVVVTDKQGKPVPGLKKEDFVVEENGKTQKISSLAKASDMAPSAEGAFAPWYLLE